LDVTDGVAELVFIESWAPEGGSESGKDEPNTLPPGILMNTSEALVSKDYKHINRITEPGQPTASVWDYVCQGIKKLQYVIRLPKTSKKAVKDIYLKVGTQKAILPFTLQPGDYIVNRGNSMLQHYSNNNEIKEEAILVESSFTLNPGQNPIEFDYKGEGRVAGPELIVNFATIK